MMANCILDKVIADYVIAHVIGKKITVVERSDNLKFNVKMETGMIIEVQVTGVKPPE